MHTRYRSLALCVLVAVVAGAHEARAALVAAQAQAQVRPGMSQDEVRAALGRPQSNRNVGRAGHSVWIYATTISEDFFQVEFGSDARVVSSQVIWVPPM